MASLIEYLTRVKHTWWCRSLYTCLHDKEFEHCISHLAFQMTWTFCLMIRNTLIMHWKEFLLNLWLCSFLSVGVKCYLLLHNVQVFILYSILEHAFILYGMRGCISFFTLCKGILLFPIVCRNVVLFFIVYIRVIECRHVFSKA
jgi:hypothetical protein